jgi:hypothetical protein
VPQAPSLTAEHERLSTFVGEWVGEERVAPSRWFEAGEARGFVTARPDIDGFAVVQDYRQERGGRISFRGHGVFTFDAADRRTKLFWFDSLGYVPQAPASGLWEGDTLTLVRPSLRGATRHIYRFEGPDAYALTIQFSPDQEGWSDLVTATYRRR